MEALRHATLAVSHAAYRVSNPLVVKLEAFPADNRSVVRMFSAMVAEAVAIMNAVAPLLLVELAMCQRCWRAAEQAGDFS
jgi:hypothetical protein